MEKVYDLHQHTHCVVMHIGKYNITTSIFSTLNRNFDFYNYKEVSFRCSISYNKDRTVVKDFGWYYEEENEDTVIVNNFRDKLYDLSKKKKADWDKEDIFLMKAVSDYLPRVVKAMESKIESFDLFHYAFIVPSEWEEEIRDDIIRPIFVQSGLISNEDHQDRLLFFSDIESIYYELPNYRFQRNPFQRGQNTVFCRLIPEEGRTLVRFDLIQTTNTLYNFPNANFFPKVMKSSSVSVTFDNLEGRIKEFLKTNLFPEATDAVGVRKSFIQFLKDKLVPFDQDQIIEAITEQMKTWYFPKLDEEELETKPWITCKKRWMLSESQEEFIKSLKTSIICAEISKFLLDELKGIISNNFVKSYEFFLIVDKYSHGDRNLGRVMKRWLLTIFEYNRRSLNSIVTKTIADSREFEIDLNSLLKGAGIGVFEAIQHSDIYCKPRIISPEDSNISLSVFLNSKPEAIVNFDISLGSTLFTYSLLDENGSIQHIFNHDYFIADKFLPPLGHFYTFSNTTTLNVKEKFIPFAERYLLGDLADFTADDGFSIKKDLLLEMKALLSSNLSNGEVLVSTNRPKYIKAFILMYMIYIKEEILNKLPDHLIPDQLDPKIGYAVSIEAMLLNNTIGTKDNLQDIIFASGLVPKNDKSKKLRITTQGERILPAIQKSLELEFPLKSYFLLCQLHEDYVQLSLHQVVTAFISEEKEQESIIAQDEIVAIPNIYDSLCASMWQNLVPDSSFIELCEMHDTSDNSKILDLFSLKTKKEFFVNLKSHISNNVLQNNPGTQSTVNTNAVKLNLSCNCKVRLTTADIIDISFTPVLQDIACTLSASLLNKELFGNYINIDYMFTFIRFNNNPQLQYAFARILEEEAVDFNLELGIDTSCFLVPELFSQLLQPVIAQRSFCYEDFKTGALQQVCTENYVAGISQKGYQEECILYKTQITDTKTVECGLDTVFPFLNKGEIINNGRSNRTFYLENKHGWMFANFTIEMFKFKPMTYLENNEVLSRNDNIYERAGDRTFSFGTFLKNKTKKDINVPLMVSISYVSYTSTLQFSVKLVGADIRNTAFVGVFEMGEPLTLTRF